MSRKYEELHKAIKDSSNILLVPHKYPDGDALGSSLALYIALKKMGKNVWLISHTPIPTKYEFLSKDYTFLPLELVTSNLDLIIGVDCADRDRLNLPDSYLEKAKIVVNIDHHITNDNFGDINIVQGLAATGEIIVDIFDDFGFEIDKDIATCLYTAISTDTGNFMFSNTTKNTFLRMAELFDTGFDFVDIARHLFLEKSLVQTRLTGMAINKMEMHCDNRIALININKSDMAAIGAREGDCESLANTAVDIDSVDVAIFIREVAKNFYKISLRSKGDYDIAAIAQKFGGGGHKNAAGCAQAGEYEAVKDLVLTKVKGLING